MSLVTLRAPSSHRITRPVRGALLNWFEDAAAPRRSILPQLLRDLALGDLPDLLAYVSDRWPEPEARETSELVRAGLAEADVQRYASLPSYEKGREMQAHVVLMAIPDRLFLSALESAEAVSAAGYREYDNSSPDPTPYINDVFENHGVPWRLERGTWASVDAAPTPTVPAPATSAPVGTLVADVNDRNPFDVPWDALDHDALVRFLEGAGDENLYWEAKGSNMQPEHVARTCAAFANAEGGYLIIGAAREADGTWLIDGVELKDEATVWVSKTIRTSVSPNPDYRVRAWTLSNGRHVAVVQVQPNFGMLCVTNGQIHHRRDGETAPLSDGATLHQVSSAVLARSRQLPRNLDGDGSASPGASVTRASATGPAGSDARAPGATDPRDGPATFVSVARQLVADGKEAELNIKLAAAAQDVRQALTAGDDPRLSDALDRMSDIAAIAYSYDPTGSVAARATRSFHDAFDFGASRAGRTAGISAPQLHVELLARARALGALAIRLGLWSILRPLILHDAEGQSLRASWLRHGDIAASNAHLYSAGPNLLEGSRMPLRLAAQHALRLESMRPDGVSDEDALITSICQFDFAFNLIGAWEAQDESPHRAVLPYFAAWDGDRVRPLAARLIDDAECRSALLPGVDDEDLAVLMRFTAARSHKASEGLGSWGFWDGFEEGRVARFLAEHPPSADADG